MLPRVAGALGDVELRLARGEGLAALCDIAGTHADRDAPAIGAGPASILRHAVSSLAADQLRVQDALDTLFGSY